MAATKRPPALQLQRGGCVVGTTNDSGQHHNLGAIGLAGGQGDYREGRSDRKRAEHDKQR